MAPCNGVGGMGGLDSLPISIGDLSNLNLEKRPVSAPGTSGGQRVKRVARKLH